MKFLILLDNPSQSYFPGQVVSGRVILELDREKSTTGLKLKCIGRASVHWTENESYTTGSGSNRRTETRSKTYSADEKYFEHKIYLIGDENSPTINIPPGSQAYSFAFELAKGIPSSFQALDGRVEYFLEATIKRSWKFDHNAKLVFTVNGLVDLNVFPGANNPTEFRKEKNLCCLCCASGPLGFSFRMNRAGFVPGETLQFVVNLFNETRRNLPGTRVQLMRVTTFHTTGKTRSTTQKIIEARGPGINPGENEVWEGDGLKIPPIPPTDLGGCRIISVTYYLEVNLKVPGGLDLSDKAPIIIGTIPFRVNFQELMPRGPAEPQSDKSQEPNANASAPFEPSMFGYPDMPPPSYQDATGEKFEGTDPPSYGEVGGDGESAPPPPDQPFVPRYATYGWTSATGHVPQP